MRRSNFTCRSSVLMLYSRKAKSYTSPLKSKQLLQLNMMTNLRLGFQASTESIYSSGEKWSQDESN